MKKRLPMALMGSLIIIAAVLLGGFIFLRLPRFGALPEGDHLRNISQSNNYAEGQFRNHLKTTKLKEGHSSIGIMLDYLFSKKERRAPLECVRELS